MNGAFIKPILKLVSRYEGGTEEMDVVPPREGDPFDEWDTKLRFNLTPEQAAKAETGSYREYYEERKMRRRARKRLGSGIWWKLGEEERQMEMEEERAMWRRRREDDDDDDGPIDWAALGYDVYTVEEWEKLQLEKNGGKVEEPKKVEERVYTGITVTVFNPFVDNFKKKWMEALKLEIKIEGEGGGGGGVGGGV